MDVQHREDDRGLYSANEPEQASNRGLASANENNSGNNNNNNNNKQLSNRPFVIIAAAFLATVVAVVLVVVLVVPDDNSGNSSVALPKVPPRPADPNVTVSSTDDKLAFIRNGLAQNNVTQALLNVIPSDAAALEGKYNDASVDPVIRAASWVVHQDTYNQQYQLVRRFALATIYYANGGSSWWNSTNWLSSSSSHCEWYGVGCCLQRIDVVSCADTVVDDVAELDFHNNNLVGNIQDVLSLFQNLRFIFLSKNSLTGEINGPALSSLPKLTMLYLQHNQLNGTIPTTLYTYQVMTTLFVQGNNLVGTWPTEYCPACPTGGCPGKIDTFGLDCAEVQCSGVCCTDDQCFYDPVKDEL